MLECLTSNSLFELIGVWLLLTGAAGLLAIGIDKSRAVHQEWRISEKTLFVMALLGGFLGVATGMQLFHHKTSKLSFIIVVYAISALWVALLFRVGFVGCLTSTLVSS
ncbi:MAG TPA: DUF1294 domain-containing protein [Nitrososphaerales archaeon]|nr:DUF1294 domain-containing protein [Nitrososphaerales archaeon]